MLPNFIIAGTEKSGTSSLIFYLSEHEDIFTPPKKEIHFFEDDNNFKKGVEWYKKWFSKWSGEKAIGECTPLYMYFPHCPQRISDIYPDMKIIFILRNPVDRAYSNYWHQVRGGKENLTFEASLKKEQGRIKTSKYHNKTYSYMNKGFYFLQIERFLKYFPKEQILIVKFDELKRYPQKTLNEIYRFLEVKLKDNQQSLNLKKNITRVPKNKYLQFYARRLFGTSALFKGIAKLNLKYGHKTYPTMNQQTKRELKNHFANDIKRLELLTGMKFSEWKN